MSPDQQEAAIAEIVASQGPSPAPRNPRPQDAATPTTQPQAGPIDPQDPSLPPVSPSGPSGPGPRFDAKWLADQEAAYQAEQADRRRTHVGDGPPPTAIKTSAPEAFGLGAIDSLSFGFDDEVGSGLAAVIPGIGKKSIWDGSSLSDAYGANVEAYRKEKDQAWQDHPYAYAGGGLATALVPIGAASKLVTGGKGIAKALSAATETEHLATKAKLLKSAKDGAVAGAAYGFGSDTGNPLDRLDGAAFGGVAGAIGGAGLQAGGTLAAKAVAPVVDRALPKVAQARFAASQADNPHVLTDAQVSDDLDKLVRTMMTGGAKAKLNSKSQRKVLLDRVSDLERSYLPIEEVNALDLPPSVKARLKAAMAKRHLISDEEVSALADGTPVGEAVSNAIAKARRLRAYVADVTGEGRGMGNLIAEAAGSAAGWKLGGPIGGAAGGVLGRSLSPSGASEAAKAAIDLASKAAKFRKLPEVLAAKEASETGALNRLVSEALDAPYLAKQEAERLASEGRKVGIANARDNVKPAGGFRGLLYDRIGLMPDQQDAGALAALKDGVITPEQFDAFLSSPEKLMHGNMGNHLSDRLAHMAETGKLKRDPDWSPPAKATAPLAAREAELLARLDEIDPVRMSLGDDMTPVRDSEAGIDMAPEVLKEAQAIRAELQSLKVSSEPRI